MKNIPMALVLALSLFLMVGVCGAAVGYEDDGSGVGITAIGIGGDEGDDVTATGTDEAGDTEKNTLMKPLLLGAGLVVLLGGSAAVVYRKKS